MESHCNAFRGTFKGGYRGCKSSNEIGTLQLLLRESSVFKAISRSNRVERKWPSEAVLFAAPQGCISSVVSGSYLGQATRTGLALAW